MQGATGIPEHWRADCYADEGTPPPAKAKVLKEAAQDGDQNGGHAQQAVIMLIDLLPGVLGPDVSVIDIGQYKLMLLEE